MAAKISMLFAVATTWTVCERAATGGSPACALASCGEWRNSDEFGFSSFPPPSPVSSDCICVYGGLYSRRCWARDAVDAGTDLTSTSLPTVRLRQAQDSPCAAPAAAAWRINDIRAQSQVCADLVPLLHPLSPRHHVLPTWTHTIPTTE